MWRVINGVDDRATDNAEVSTIIGYETVSSAHGDSYLHTYNCKSLMIMLKMKPHTMKTIF